MVKHLAIDLDNDLYERLVKVKGKRTWIEFLEHVVKYSEKVEY